MTAWLFTILRHNFYSEYRKRRREVQDVEGGYTKSLCWLSLSKSPALNTRNCGRRSASCPKKMRDILLLVAVGGVSYSRGGRGSWRLRHRHRQEPHPSGAYAALPNCYRFESPADFAGDAGPSGP